MPDIKPILLVEDNPNDLELTLHALERSLLANEVVIARDGAEAVDWLKLAGAHKGRVTGDPAVVLLDLKLPKLDGLQVLERIKTDDDLKHIPVVMLTASKEESDLVRSYSLGVNAFVVKPVDFKDFFKAIQDVCVFWAILNEPHPPRRREQAMKVTEV
ncbi:chemotaxis protein CheY [Aureimonas altamirensis]|uniref:Chemotaxis protein CheY n=1 Tax=Aureimonas altamirensis TaxID=370622 RepID=A0A0B1Q237_9HYPH|nr:response regulator [Aureimonas altamirensis]KHJ53077.1 chemotaxis protein CheY [Aureimonas altamirensis]